MKDVSNSAAVNAGKTWSELHLQDLRLELKRGASIAEIAALLAREASEVEAKIGELTTEHGS